MSAFFQRIRLIPIVLCVAVGLFVLKVSGIIVDGGYTLGAGHQAMVDRAAIERSGTINTRPVQVARLQEQKQKPSAAQDALGYPDVTGSVGESKPASKDNASKDNTTGGKAQTETAGEPKKAQKPTSKAPVDGTLVQLDANPMSASERALLERLSERRQELEKRQNELDMRDTLLKAAEQRLETRISDLKDAEARIVAATQQKEDAEKERLRNLVTMYENMKAKDAAKIFDRLDTRLATEVARLIQPRRMSDILAQMTPESAQRLTVELASQDSGKQPRSGAAQLPKIEGRPNGS